MALKNLLIKLWYSLFVNPFSKNPEYTFIVTKDRVGISIFQNNNGLTEFQIHLPTRHNLSTTFGLGWPNYKKIFTGKILHGTANVQIKDIKPGMAIRIFSNEIWLASFPLDIVSVFHKFNSDETCTARDIAKKSDARIVRELIYNAQAWEYTSILGTYLRLCLAYRSDFVPYQTLVSMIGQDTNLDSISAPRFIQELVDANLFILTGIDKPEQVTSSTALIHLLQSKLKK